MEIRKWRDLKDFLDTLTEEQLDQSSMILKEDEHFYISEAGFIKEDIVWNVQMDEGGIPVDEYIEEGYGFPLNDERNIIYQKGSLVRIYAD